MRQVKRWRYYCDHCKKSGCSKHHMAKHEKGCTMNPHRECGVCAMWLGGCNEPMADLIAALGNGYASLREKCENCPACTLAALRQAPCNHGMQFVHHAGDAFVGPYDEPIDDGRCAFDFRAEMLSVWADVNQERSANVAYY